MFFVAMYSPHVRRQEHSLLNDSSRKMAHAAILMELVLTLHDSQVMLGPSPVKRDFNT